MSESPATDLANEFREATVAFLWRQWRTVGATVTAGTPARAVIDPEALILMSLWLVEHERRLADVIRSWVDVNAPLLSIQRLGNLRDDFPPVVASRLGALAAHRTDVAKDIRWRSLRTEHVDDLGERTGKMRAVAPRFASWATLILQLRMGMGVGAKADTLAFLLGLNHRIPEWASVSMIADAVGYTPAAVRRVADDLAGARFIRALDTAESDQQPARMFCADHTAWGTLLGISPEIPGWGYWRERFRFVVDVLTWLEPEADHPVSEYARDVAAREILARHRLALRKDRIVDPFDSATAEPNHASLVSAVRALVTFWNNLG